MKHGKLVITGTVLGTLVIAAGGWFVGVQPFLQAAAAADGELASVQQLNDLQATRLAELQAAGDRADAIDEELAALQTEIPTGPAMADLLGQLGQIESETGVRVVSVTSGSLALIGPDPETQASGDEAAAATAPPVDIAGMESLPVTLTATGTQQATRAFLADLQRDGRLISISGVVFSTDPADETARVDITGQVYVLPSL